MLVVETSLENLEICYTFQQQMLGNKFSNVWHLREGVSYKM